ncbi:MAG: fibronectin type III domain-containing protein [Flavobacteriales bacterium]|nr:fibronectin type III domain-containing protein [Flavobacteriales bacterium]
MRSYFLLLLALCRLVSEAQDVALIPFGSTWKYRDTGSNQGTAWRASGFDDTAWASGPAQLGYGDGDEATVVSYGPSSSAKYITTYFRKTFTIADVSAFAGYGMRIKRDDGVIVYVNGTEVLRQNFNEGAIGYTTLAYQAVATTEEGQILEQILLPPQFSNGNNTIAVEVHQNAANSSDLSFHLGIDGPRCQSDCPSRAVSTIRFANGDHGLLVHGRAEFNARAVRAYPGDLSSMYEVATPLRQHEAVISGLQPNTTYYYAIGTSTQDLAGGDATHFFKTSPEQGSEQPLPRGGWGWVPPPAGNGSVRLRT